MFKIIACMTEL